jgi:hypothetical protein
MFATFSKYDMSKTTRNEDTKIRRKQPQESNNPLVLRSAVPLDLQGGRRQRRSLQIQIVKRMINKTSNTAVKQIQKQQQNRQTTNGQYQKTWSKYTNKHCQK